MADKKKRPPYTGGSDIETFFDRIKTMQAPKKIDNAWVTTYKMAPNQPEGMPSLLKWLGIIDKDGAADPTVWDGVRLPQTRPETLRPLMEAAYSEVFERLDVEHASHDDLSSTFVVAYGMGDPRRYVKCFLTLCDLAGLSTEAAAKSTENGAAAPSPARATKSEKKPKVERQVNGSKGQNGHVPIPPTTAGVLLSFAVEIPAEWDEEQIRDRVVTVARVLSEAGLGVA
ncbi:MAG TPA: DUF5343 domain-containing protein [Dehalococcoidia bacterium]|nr:DUF5343 domain-containing protein [Dehalococcoidia bacterium]